MARAAPLSAVAANESLHYVDRVGRESFSNHTSNDLLSGIPVPCVSPPMSAQTGGPYGRKSRPVGISSFGPALQRTVADPDALVKVTWSPSHMSSRFMSLAFRSTVSVSTRYSSLDLPWFRLVPWRDVRPGTRINTSRESTG